MPNKYEPVWVQNIRGMLKGIPFTDEMKAACLSQFNEFYEHATVADTSEIMGWFVKDFADGWIYFDNEADARREVEATGATLLVGFPPYA